MRSLHVVVCDDEPMDLAQTVELVKEYDTTGQMQIFTYMQSKDLLSRALTETFDIIFLDIEMDAPNGYETAKQLIQRHNPPVIIFVTKSSEYTLKGYGIALRYLQKPISKSKLEEALDAAVQEASAHKLYFTSEDMTIALPFREIVFIEMYGHYAVIHTATSEYRFRTTLKGIQGRLPKGYFAIPHKSIIVNLDHIRYASSTEIFLDNDAKVPISRRRQQEFNQAFYRFLER